MGDFYILLAATTWAVYSVCGRTAVQRLGSGPFTVWTILIGTVAIGTFLPFGDFTWPTTARAWVFVGVLGVFCTLIPFWTWNAAQKYLPISTLGMTAYFTPVAAVTLAALILGETVTGLQCLGIVFVCASAVVECRGH